MVENARFSGAIKSAEADMAEARRKLDAFSHEVEAVRSKMRDVSAADTDLDIENTSLDSVHAHYDTMNANIAELIVGLDEVTAGLSKNFEAMRAHTVWETVVGWFSTAKAEALRAERIHKARFDDKLQDLIGTADLIIKTVEDQLAALDRLRELVERDLSDSLGERETVVGDLEALKVKIAEMDPAIIALENRIADGVDAAARTKLDTELADLKKAYNDMVQEEQIKLARSQTLERFIEKGKSWVNSLENHAATQVVLINKLRTDAKQRVVLYNALTESLKLAQRRDAARGADDNGAVTDEAAPTASSTTGSATWHRIAELMEANGDKAGFANKVREEKVKSDERFARLFARS